jgi:hypothetical protein
MEMLENLGQQALKKEAAGKTSLNPEVEGGSGSSRDNTTQEPAGDPSSSRATKRQREDESGNPSKEPCWALKVGPQVKSLATTHIRGRQLG